MGVDGDASAIPGGAMSDEMGQTPTKNGGRGQAFVGIALAVLVASLVVVLFAQLRSSTASTDASARYAPAGVANPSDLVGVWWPRGRDSLDGRLLAVGAGEFAVFDDFCKADGSWRASSSGLMSTFYTSSGSGQCDGVFDVSDGWFAGITWFVVKEDRVELLSASGKTVLTLEPAEQSSTKMLDGLAQKFPAEKPVAPLPAGFEVPSTEQLVDVRWLPLDVPVGHQGAGADRAFAEFSGNGYWQASDGCNGQRGSWALHPDTGEWLATSGFSTLMGCANVPVAETVTGAAAVGLDGEQLVFFGAGGDEMDRFAPEPAPVG